MEVKAKVNPSLGLLFNLGALASILFILSMTLIQSSSACSSAI
jgi:hypothetical protein